MKRRPYQQQSIDNVFDAYQQGISNQLCVLATGLGKTYIAGNIIKELPMRLACGGRVLWLTHEEGLIDQSAVSVMSTLFPEQATMIKTLVGEAGGIINFMSAEHNLFGAPDLASTYQLLKRNLGIVKQKLFNIQPNLVVASVQTMINRLDKIPANHFDMVVVDEAHYAMAASWSKVLEHFSPKIRLGLTATPERLDGLSLGDLFDKIVAEYDIKFGVDNNFLCELEAISLKTGLSLDNVRTTAGELNQKDLRVLDCPERNNKIVDAWFQYAQDRPTIVFCVDMEHAQNVCQAFMDRDVSASFVVADEKICPNRKERIRNFKAGKITVMCNVAILTAGFDYPDVGCIIPASPTKSKSRYLQQIGRGTRLKTQRIIDQFGQNCIILDPTDNSVKHEVINAWSLENGKRLEDRVFMGKERKASLINQRDKRELKHEQKADERRNLLTLPELKVLMDSPWMKDPATEGQLKWIASLGYDVVNDHFTKGQCNQIISASDATYTQKSFLKAHGYFADHCTRGQFELAKIEIDARLAQQEIAGSLLFKNSPIIGIS